METSTLKSSQKELAISFLQKVTSGKIREAYGSHMSPQFRHHNAYCKGDTASLIEGMEQNEKHFPNKDFKVQRALEDGDLVAVHSKLVLKARELELAVVHIFRFEGNLIAELWDIAQQIPADSPNESGMF